LEEKDQVVWAGSVGMIRKNQRLLNFINMFMDGCILFVSYLLAVWFRFAVLHGNWGIDILGAPFLALVAIYSIVIIVVFYAFQLYGSFRYKSIGIEGVSIFGIHGVGVLVLMALAYVLRIVEFPRMVLTFYWIFAGSILVLKRWVVRSILKYYRALGYNQKFVIVVGNGTLAHRYVKDLKNQAWTGFRMLGYLSDSERSELGKRLGTYEELEQILEKQFVDELVVALEPHEMQFMKPVLAAADKEGVRISIIPFYSEYIPAHPTIESVGDTKLINMRSTPLDKIGWALLKRGMDIVGSLLLIILTSPVMLFTAIGVKLSSPGPILFKQERVGKDKKKFMMLKFRSMRMVDMKGTQDTAWSTDEDPRKTKFGSFIRKCSIDELPQFFNVLKGDMSLIGPRPEIPYHVNHFKEEVPLYLVRQQVRPGMTGWAQVHGLRGDTSIEERVKYDIWYIENWSLGLDIKIMWKTVFGGFINNEKMQA
jgi:Undecaprenyl-phosphate glucose phosphotransferase